MRSKARAVANESRVTRVGFLSDNDSDEMAAVYEFDDVSVRLHIPFHAHVDVRERWWGHGIQYMDDPQRMRYKYSPPDELLYYDSSGTVALLGCTSGPARWNFRFGTGTIRARFAVEGAHDPAHYVKINGLRSEIDGLSHWIGIAAHSTEVSLPSDGKPLQVTTTMTSVDDIPLARSLNLKVAVRGSAPGAWSPEVTYRSQAFVETQTSRKHDWSDHLEHHTALRDLLRVAAWKPINFQSHHATSTNERMPLSDGREVSLWHEVRTVTTGISDPTWRQGDRFLFSFADITRVGVAKWLILSRSYRRGIEPFVRLLDLEGATVDAVLSQLGIAIEAIGYQALIDSGRSPGGANRTTVERRIDHLLGEVAGTLTFADATFARNFTESYNSIKHANRPQVDPGIKIENLRNGVELIRTWIALRLGVKSNDLRSRR